MGCWLLFYWMAGSQINLFTKTQHVSGILSLVLASSRWHGFIELDIGRSGHMSIAMYLYYSSAKQLRFKYRGNSCADAAVFTMYLDAQLKCPNSITSPEHIFNGILWLKGIFGGGQAYVSNGIICQPHWSIVTHTRPYQSWVCPKGQELLYS